MFVQLKLLSYTKYFARVKFTFTYKVSKCLFVDKGYTLDVCRFDKSNLYTFIHMLILFFVKLLHYEG